MASDLLYANASISGACSTPANAHGTNDGTFTTDIDNTSWTHRWGFDNPTVNPDINTGINASLRLTVRHQDGTGNPQIDSVALFDSTGQIAIVSTGWTITSASSQQITISIPWTSLTDTTGDSLEVQIVTTAAGGNPGSRSAAQVDEIRLDVDMVVPAPPRPVEVKFASVTNPGKDTGHRMGLVMKMEAGDTGDVDILLLQGTTTIKTFANQAITTSFVEYELAIDSTSAGNITDYSDLRVRVTGSAVANIQPSISWAWFDVPESTGPLPIDGSLAETLADYLGAAEGWIQLKGAVAATLEGAVGAAEGLAGLDGTIAETLDDYTAVAEGIVEVTGTAADIMEDFGITANGQLGAEGPVAEVMADYIGAASGFLSYSGSVAETLEDYVGAAEGNLAVTGTVGVTLDDFLSCELGEFSLAFSNAFDLDLCSSGIVGVSPTGTVDVTLEDFVSTAVGHLSYIGSLAETMDDFVSTATGQVRVDGSLAETMEDFTADASGWIEITGSVSEVMDDFTSDADGGHAHTGSVDETMDDFVGEAVGVVETTGTVDVTMEDFVSSALGSVEGFDPGGNFIGKRVW